MAEKATTWDSVLAPGDGDPRHGWNGYSNLGCRCEICREANADYNLSIRQTRARRIVADPSLRPHGVYTTYLNWACRCNDCRRACAEYSRRRRARTKATSPSP